MSEWVKSSEELPDNIYDVLCFVPCEGLKIGYYSQKMQSWRIGDDYQGHVTHWMLLPEDPR